MLSSFDPNERPVLLLPTVLRHWNVEGYFKDLILSNPLIVFWMLEWFIEKSEIELVFIQKWGESSSCYEFSVTGGANIFLASTNPEANPESRTRREAETKRLGGEKLREVKLGLSRSTSLANHWRGGLRIWVSDARYDLLPPKIHKVSTQIQMQIQ